MRAFTTIQNFWIGLQMEICFYFTGSPVALHRRSPAAAKSWHAVVPIEKLRSAKHRAGHVMDLGFTPREIEGYSGFITSIITRSTSKKIRPLHSHGCQKLFMTSRTALI